MEFPAVPEKPKCKHILKIIEMYNVGKKSRFFGTYNQRIYVMQCTKCGEIGTRKVDMPKGATKA